MPPRASYLQTLVACRCIGTVPLDVELILSRLGGIVKTLALQKGYWLFAILHSRCYTSAGGFYTLRGQTSFAPYLLPVEDVMLYETWLLVHDEDRNAVTE